MAARSPAAETAGAAEMKPSALSGVDFGSSASNRSSAVSQTLVGRSRQPTAMNRWSGLEPMPTLQASPIGVEAKRRYGEDASHTLAVPSSEAPRTRDPASNRA